MIDIAHISMLGKKVGSVAWNKAQGFATFEYDKDFWINGWDPSPIKMPMQKGSNRIFYFRELQGNKTFKGLPGLLADSLPDKYGNDLIDAWMKSQGRHGDLNPVETLCFIGNRGMGALEFSPAYTGLSNHAQKLEVENLVKVASEILTSKKDFKSKLSNEDKKYIFEIFKIGTSAGGMRPKAIISFNPQTNEVRSGQVDAPPGFSHWIIKFDGMRGEKQGYGKVEMAYHLMAKDCGINMPECRLFEENGRTHFMIKRFDRVNNKKVHVQTWCSLTHTDFYNPTRYEDLFRTMRLLNVPSSDFYELYRRMVFNVMAMNYDDHAKNFAFTMDKHGKWSLSPAYDTTYSYKQSFLLVHKRASSINGKRTDITREDLVTFARRMNISNPEKIIKKVSEVVKEWPLYATSQKVDMARIKKINKVLTIL